MADKRRQYGTGSVYQRPDGRWIGASDQGWTVRGTRRRVTVVAASEADAKRKLKAKLRDIDSNGLPDDTTGRATVKSWSEQWLTITQREVRPKTWQSNRSCIKKWIVPAIGHKALTKLTPGDVRAVTKAIRDANLSPNTAVRAHAVLSKCLRDALVEGHPIPPAVLHVRPPKSGESDRDAIPLPQAVALLDHVSQLADGSRWAAALLQGMRQGECLGLTWDAIDFDRNVLDVSWQLQALPYVTGRKGDLRVPDGYLYRQLFGALCLVRPKSKSGTRIVPLVPWMRSSLLTWQQEAQPSPHGLVWPQPNGCPRIGSEDRQQWYDMQKALNIRHPADRPYYLHEARHSAATLLMEARTDPKVIEAVLGHSSMMAAQGYRHVSDALAREAMEAVAERLHLN